MFLVSADGFIFFCKECALREGGAAPKLTAMASSRCLYLSASSILPSVKQDKGNSQRSQVKQDARKSTVANYYLLTPGIPSAQAMYSAWQHFSNNGNTELFQTLLAIGILNTETNK